MLVIFRFTDVADDGFAERAEQALAALAGRPGYRRGTLGRAADDPAAWLLLTEWEHVGAYRRALGSYEVKVAATPLLAQADDTPSAFEPLLSVEPGGAVTSRAADRAADAGTTQVGAGRDRFGEPAERYPGSGA